MKPYYYVYRVGGEKPVFKHETLEEALLESERLANKQAGDSFEILQCLGVTRRNTAQTFWLDGQGPTDSKTEAPPETSILEVEIIQKRCDYITIEVTAEEANDICKWSMAYNATAEDEQKALNASLSARVIKRQIVQDDCYLGNVEVLNHPDDK